MATLNVGSLRAHMAQGPWQQAGPLCAAPFGKGRCDGDTLREDLERQVLLLHDILTVGRPATTVRTAAGEAANIATMAPEDAHPRCSREEGSDIKELLHMKRLLAEKLGEARVEKPHQVKPFHGLLLNKTVLSPSCILEEASTACTRTPPSSRSACSSPQESPKAVARVLMKDGLAYVVR